MHIITFLRVLRMFANRLHKAPMTYDVTVQTYGYNDHGFNPLTTKLVESFTIKKACQECF